MAAPQVDEIGRIKGESEGPPIERRKQLPEGADIFTVSQELKVELGRQQDKRAHRVKRDQEPLDPL